MATEQPDILTKKKKQAIILNNLVVLVLVIVVLISLAVQTVNSIIGLQSRGILYDCATVGGECYNQSIERANVRAELTKDVIVLTAVCSEEPMIRAENDRVARIRLIENCVNEQLAKEEQR